MECRDINEGVVKPSLANVLVVIEWEILEWLLENEFIIRIYRQGGALLAERGGQAKAESCGRS